MENIFLSDLINNKIKLNDDKVLSFIQSNFTSLSPASKYQVFLLTGSIVINSLKRIDAFRNTNLDVNFFMDKFLDEAILKFEEYKNEHNKTYNTFKHRSSIIESNLNRGNRDFFKKTYSTLREESYIQLGHYTLELERATNFNDIFINLFCFPNFNIVIDRDEQPKLSNSYLSIIKSHDSNQIERFKIKFTELVNQVIAGINDDSFFITKMSNINPSNGKGSKSCYIATLVYEDIEHPNVNALRKYRDDVLSENFFGRLFIYFYYKISPHTISFLVLFPKIQKLIKKALDNWVSKNT